jgi:hypothetical protein
MSSLYWLAGLCGVLSFTFGWSYQRTLDGALTGIFIGIITWLGAEAFGRMMPRASGQS